MKRAYDRSFSPPAPILPIEIFDPEDPQQRAQVSAKLDTAADMSAVPAQIVNDWGLEPVSEVIVAGYDSRVEVLPTYTVGLELPQTRIRCVEVIAIPDPYVLLGRDILNHFYIDLDGPDLTWELSFSPHTAP